MNGHHQDNNHIGQVQKPRMTTHIYVMLVVRRQPLVSEVIIMTAKEEVR